LLKGALGPSGLDGRRNTRNTAVGHGLSLRKPVLVSIILLSPITILFGGIVKETTAAIKVG
jgi:hypothetical protein